MAVPLNKVPQGLLDFFGVKSGEWGPRELGQLLQPVLELGPWYQNGYALEVAAVLPAGGAFVANTPAASIALTSTTPVDLVVGGTIPVPQNEVWLVLEAAVFWTFTVPAAGQFADAHWVFRGIHMPCAHPTGRTTGDAAVVSVGGRTMSRPFWVRPGDTISLNQAGLVIPAGTVILGARLRINRFQI